MLGVHGMVKWVIEVDDALLTVVDEDAFTSQNLLPNPCIAC